MNQLEESKYTSKIDVQGRIKVHQSDRCTMKNQSTHLKNAKMMVHKNATNGHKVSGNMLQFTRNSYKMQASLKSVFKICQKLTNLEKWNPKQENLKLQELLFKTL